jgi:hypothetical protein
VPPILGWLVGVGLLVSSPLWTARQKGLSERIRGSFGEGPAW